LSIFALSFPQDTLSFEILEAPTSYYPFEIVYQGPEPLSRKPAGFRFVPSNL